MYVFVAKKVLQTYKISKFMVNSDMHVQKTIVQALVW